MPHAGVPTLDLAPQAAAGLRVAVISATWNEDITDRLHHRAIQTATELGAVVKDWRVAGALELPIAVAAACSSFDVVIACGCVIQGETDHFRVVCDAVTYGLTRISLDHNTPVGNAVLTVNTHEQALARAGGDNASEDKGADATIAAIQAALTIHDITTTA